MNQQPLDSKEEILDRHKAHTDTAWRDTIYGLRLVTANYIDLASRNTVRPASVEGKYVPVHKKTWELGRHNPVQVNTRIQAQSLAFSRPELRWEGCKGENPEITAEVRAGYYGYLWDDCALHHAYMGKLLDILISGEGSFQAGVRDGKVYGEYMDALDVTWDSAYKGTKRRFYFLDRHLRLSDAMRQYPELAKHERWSPGQKGGEKMVTVTEYCSKTTRAALYKGQFIVDPMKNPYGVVNARSATLFQEPSVRHPVGQVDLQLGPAKLFMRLLNKFRDVTLRGSPVGVAYNLDDNDVDRIASGEEGVVVKSKGQNGAFAWTPGPDIGRSDMELLALLQQHLGEASSVNDFMKGRTDTKVDFATQLSMLAAQSGITGQYAANIFETGLKEDAELLMIVGELYQGPVEIKVGGETQMFDALMPINPLLGDDGDIFFKPGSTAYKSPMQKLQETAVLANVLSMAQGLPGGVGLKFIELALTSFEVDDKDDWVAAYQAAQEQQAMAQQMAQGAVPQDFGLTPETAGPQGQPAA